jgi:ABC-2 type transport system ATP-binding protein
MSEMALTADRLVIVGKGRLIAEADTAEFTATGEEVFVRTGDPAFARRLELVGAQVLSQEGGFVVTGITAPEVGRLAAAEGVTLHELTPRRTSLEAAFMELTRDSVEYSAGQEATR